VAGEETWQEDTTVTLTLSEAVRVAARAGSEASPNARRPKANIREAYFMAFTLFVTRENALSNLIGGLLSNLSYHRNWISISEFRPNAEL
jgi:hypothetical protein